MTARPEDCHGRGLPIAQGDVGTVSVRPCGVVTLTMQYLSLRLEADAFHALSTLLAQAQARLDGFGGHSAGAGSGEAGESAAAPLPPHGIH